METIRTETLLITTELRFYLKQLAPLLAGIQSTQDSLDSAESKLSLREKAELQAYVIFAIDTLSYVYLKLIGCNPKNHQVKVELERVKLFFARTAKKEDEEKVRVLKADVGAVKRFIKHGLGKEQYEEGGSSIPKMGKHTKF